MSICDLLMGTKKIFHIFAILFYEKSCKKIYPSKQLNIVNSEKTRRILFDPTTILTVLLRVNQSADAFLKLI